MTSFWTGLARGAAAGAAGTTALQATTYSDVALRARPESDLPARLVARLADRAGTRVPGGRRERSRRLAGLGPLTGIAVGIGLGSLAGGLRAAGLRLPAAVGGPLLGAAAMAATDGPAALLGLTDPRRWSATDWAADAVPHLVYGVTTHAVLEAALPAPDPADESAPATTNGSGPGPRGARVTALLRAAALGAASGARSTAGATAVALTSGSLDRGPAGRIGRGRPAAALLTAGELVADKLPGVPARTAPAGLLPRAGLGATAAAAAARRDGSDPVTAGLVGLGAAVGAAALGVRARAAAQRRFGSDLPGALAEDALAGLLGWLGTRRPVPLGSVAPVLVTAEEVAS